MLRDSTIVRQSSMLSGRGLCMKRVRSESHIVKTIQYKGRSGSFPSYDESWYTGDDRFGTDTSDMEETRFFQVARC